MTLAIYRLVRQAGQQFRIANFPANQTISSLQEAKLEFEEANHVSLTQNYYCQAQLQVELMRDQYLYNGHLSEQFETEIKPQFTSCVID